MLIDFFVVCLRQWSFD